jgi:hypothetical protein
MTAASAAPGRLYGVEADALDAMSLAVLVIAGDGVKDRGQLSRLIRGDWHLANCPRGQWLSPTSPRPDGDPCMERCVRARDARDRLLDAMERLAEQMEASTVRQLSLTERKGA